MTIYHYCFLLFAPLAKLVGLIKIIGLFFKINFKISDNIKYLLEDIYLPGVRSNFFSKFGIGYVNGKSRVKYSMINYKKNTKSII